MCGRRYIVLDLNARAGYHVSSLSMGNRLSGMGILIFDCAL